MSKVTIDIEGIEEVRQALRSLGNEMKESIMRPTVTAATAEIRKSYRKFTPKGKTGNLKKSVTSQVGANKNKGIYRSWVGYGVKNGKLGFHGHLVDRGIFGKRVIPSKALRILDKVGVDVAIEEKKMQANITAKVDKAIAKRKLK